MRTSALLPALLIAASASAANQVTFDNVTLQGLTTITDSSALSNFGANLAPAIASITDANWTTDGIDSMGRLVTGALAGEFGQTYASAGNYLYLISPAYLPTMSGGHTTHIGTFSLSILLGNGQYASAGTFSDADFTITTYLVDGTYYANDRTNVFPSGEVAAQYLRIDLGALDAQGLGVAGIKLENFTSPWLDLNYVGITGGGTPVPEPSTYGLALGGLALAGAAVRRRRKA